MNTRISRSICFFLGSFFVFTSIVGRPVIPTPIEVTQPNGAKISVRLIGDEFGKLTLSEDGFVLMQDESGYYRYSQLKADGSLKLGKKRAKNIKDRSLIDRLSLNFIEKGSNRLQLIQQNQLQSRMEVALLNKKSTSNGLWSPTVAYAPNRQTGLFPSYLSKNFPKTGRPKTLVILANYADLAFKPENSLDQFSRQLNEIGYNDHGHVGSVRDYFLFNSFGRFDPDFVVVGPITVPQNSSYYGKNNSSGQDLNAHLLIRDACLAVDQMVDFSEFDNDGDSLVDNVYVFYAGKGEADGGNQSTIHPHSSNMQYYFPNFRLDGLAFNTYSCSNELNGTTEEMDGIGAFTHEFGHVLGLYDVYDTDYALNGSGFDLNDWSLMASGNYNNNSKVPPCLSIVERTLLGWSNPMEPDSTRVNQLKDFGSVNQGYVLPSINQGEFFMLENRQKDQNVWDRYIPYHGMLVYHVDVRENDSINMLVKNYQYKLSFADLWYYNLVNANALHPCCDLEEADNVQSNYWGIMGDPFPGTKRNRVFNDFSKPSSRTWDGAFLNAGITHIEEIDSLIQFRFKDYSALSEKPLGLKVKEVYPISFRASWIPVLNASHYEVMVYTSDVDGDSLHMYPLFNYTNKIVSDTAMTVWLDTEEKTYWFQVRAVASSYISPYSDLFKVQTIKGETVAQAASRISPYTFRANWQSRPYARGYVLDVFSIQPSGDTIYVDGYKDRLATYNLLDVIDVDHLQTYYYRVRMRLNETYLSDYSNTITVTTVKPNVPSFYIKDNVLYIKGMDKESRLTIRNMEGFIVGESNTPFVTLNRQGMFVASFMFEGKPYSLKISYK